ncbi:hypothetical protein [Nocardioides plantarum]|uniref:Uncharacterized protein n=1 Tax=Nocardioides plantarum TaxID=29299 RepID=A0ABV5KDD2_9ACTN|nr:hypothetical protein [Nocardioides plantarum]
MPAVLIFMSVIVVVAVLALAYAAYPHRGAPVPGAPWLGDALERAAGAVPVVEDGDLDRGDQLEQPLDGALDGALDGSLHEAEPSRR